jgi:putative FmdB family regulatory protein
MYLYFYLTMPIYEYECKKCHHRFEKIQKFSDPHVKKCPECGGPIEQVITAPAVQFKGTGWYVTDYAKKSGSMGSSSNGEPSKNDSGSSSSDSGDSSSSSSKDSNKDSNNKDSGKESKSKDSSSKDSGSKSEKSKYESSGKKDRKN